MNFECHQNEPQYFISEAKDVDYFEIRVVLFDCVL